MGVHGRTMTSDATPAERDATPGQRGEGRPGREQAGEPELGWALGLLVCWMVSTLAFAGLAVALLARLHPVLAGVTGILWFLGATIGVPLMLYDAHAIRDTPPAGGFRFDPFWTAVVLLLVYPLGLPIYLITRMNGAYVATMDVDPGEMALGDEFEFGVQDLLNPTEGGVPAVWPAVLVLFAWGAVLFMDASLALVAIERAGGTALVAGLVAGIFHVVGAGVVAYDGYLLVGTGYLDTGQVAGITLAMALLYPVAAVAYLPYRLQLTYG